MKISQKEVVHYCHWFYLYLQDRQGMNTYGLICISNMATTDGDFNSCQANVTSRYYICIIIKFIVFSSTL